MDLGNPFAKFLGKRTNDTPGMKRSRLENDALVASIKELSPRGITTTTAKIGTTAVTAAANVVISPNAAEFSGVEMTFPRCTAFPSPVKVLLPAEEGDEEEENELRLLLGGPNKVFVRSQKVATPAALPNEPHMAASFTLAPAATALCELSWATRSNNVLAAIAERFETQFRWELRQDVDLLRVFEPFFSDRALSRIKTDKRGLQFLPAPTVTLENTSVVGDYALRSYQIEGVQFLLNNFHGGISCILADDMGLGKTAQISAFLHMLKTQHNIDGPHLIVAPLSTLTGWTRELARWAPTLRVVKYHGEKKGRAALRMGRGNRHCVFVTTPSVLNQDRGFFRKRTWVAVVVDEAHVLKGSSTMISYVARKLKACFRLAVTGTPVHNRVSEVWSLMSFLFPSYCTSYDASDDDDPITGAEDCAKLLQRIMLRRTKGAIELGIPPRIDEPALMIPPTVVQQQLLTRMAQQALNREDVNGTRLQVHLTHYRVVCSHPLALRLLATEGRGSSLTGWEERMASAGIALDEESIIAPSAKMIELDRLLREFKANGHRCLIFSNFTSVLDLLQALCVLRGYSFERLDGSTDRVERELSMIRFNSLNSACFVFLLTTTAGGVGVTLTGADTVILFDAHYNPQIDRQAADRAHRIGQTRVVRVYRFCLSNTIEERILNVAQRKASLGDFIVDGGSSKGDESCNFALSAGQIRLLLGDDSQATFASSDAPQGGKAMGVDCDTLAEHLMVEDLLRVETEGLPVSFVGKTETRSVRPAVGVTQHCFVCQEIMRPLEPLYHCALCPKAYHAECVGERKPKPGMAGPRHWTCPRHSCVSCGEAQAVGGAVFMCTECPSSFCFDCLDPRYFVLDDTGIQFVHINRAYSEMEREGMVTRRSVYYITCLRCSGVLSSSSSSSSSVSSTSSADDTDINVVDDDDECDGSDSVKEV